MIKEMHENRMKIRKIAEELGISRPTVRKYVGARGPPEYSKKRRKIKVEDYIPYIRRHIEEYDLSAVRILDEIRDVGHTGSYSLLKHFCSTVIQNRQGRQACPMIRAIRCESIKCLSDHGGCIT